MTVVRPEPGRASAMAGGPEAACDGPNGHGHGTADGLRPGQTSARPLPDLGRTCGRGA